MHDDLYIIGEYISMDSLVKYCNMLMRDGSGWTPCGGPFINPKHNTVCQAMSRLPNIPPAGDE